ncbi:MAG: hypothetical protein K5770_14175 [Lachnospiraceae bacterium]|nr:hypothetical protein [Lachnospiraceae bacterium]
MKILKKSGQSLGYIAYMILFCSIVSQRVNMADASRWMLVISLVLMSARYIADIVFCTTYGRSHICQAVIVSVGIVIWFVIALISPYTEKNNFAVIVLEAVMLLLMSFFWCRQFVHHCVGENISQWAVEGIKKNWGVVVCVLYTLLMSLGTLKWIPLWDEGYYTDSLLDARYFDFTVSNINLLCGHLSYGVNAILFPAIQFNVTDPYLCIRLWILLYLLADAALSFFLFRKLIPSISNLDVTIISVVFLSFVPIIGMQSPNLDYIGIVVLIGMLFFYYYEYWYLFILSSLIFCFTKEPLAVLYAGFLLGIFITNLIGKRYNNLKGYILSTIFFSLPFVIWLVIFSIPTVMGIVTGNYQSSSIWGMKIGDNEMYNNEEEQYDVDVQEYIMENTDVPDPGSLEEQDSVKEQINITDDTAVTEEINTDGHIAEAQNDPPESPDMSEPVNTDPQPVPEAYADNTGNNTYAKETDTDTKDNSDDTELSGKEEIYDEEGEDNKNLSIGNLQVRSGDVTNGFFFSQSYVVSKLNEMLSFHFLWIPLLLLLVICDIRLFRRLKSLIPVFLAIVSYAAINCIFHTYDEYRYVMTGSVLVLLLSLTGLSVRIRNKTVLNGFFIALGVLFVVEQFTVIDPATMYRRDVYSSGNGKFVYLDNNNIEDLYISPAIQTNRQGYEYGNFIEKILATIDYDESTLLLIPEMKFHPNTVSMRGTFVEGFSYDKQNNKLVTLSSMSEGKTKIHWGRLDLSGGVEILGEDKSQASFDRVFLLAFPFLDNDDYIQAVYNLDLKMKSSRDVEYGTWAAKAIELEDIDLFYLEKKMEQEESDV